jgi:hypothetical protein
MKNTGSCLCNQVRFNVNSVSGAIGHCHCKMCQKFHGAAFSTFVEVKLDDLDWLSGKDLLKTFRATNDTVRTFCACCGSSLLFESKYNRSESTVEVALSVFDTLDTVHPDAHIYTASKAKWFDITDTLPQFLQYRKS